MKNYHVHYGLLTLVLLIIISGGCGKKQKLSEGPERPYQPWVFRSVLDSQSRILTLALHDDLWAAYHTDSCSLYKVWKGHVQLQGAVYDNAHGPQPISLGDAWLVNPHKKPWSVMKDGKAVLRNVQYKGHSLTRGHASLHYQLVCEDNTRIDVVEKPEFIQKKDGQVGFERVFSIESSPPGYVVGVAQHVSSIALHSNLETNGEWKINEETKSTWEGRQLLSLHGNLTLKPDGETFFRTYFIGKPTIENTTKLDTEVSLTIGEQLIGKNDCKTCHNEKVQTIGPAYLHIAEKYAFNEANVVQLSNKIIKGGGGIWGSQVMSPHPELPVSDANEMVRYILSLDTTDAGQDGEGTGVDFVLKTTVLEDKNMLPGLFVEGYVNQKGFDKIPTYPVSKKSDQAGVVADLYGVDVAEFGTLSEDFVLIAKGYLYADRDTLTDLRIWSDDGSRVTVDGQVILDNDGLHGTEVKETTVSLSKGYHPVTIEYMQGKGGRYLSFEWKPAGAVDWAGVPPEALFHSSDSHVKMQGKTLALSTVNRIPGDKSAVVSVHPSYDLKQARPWDFLPKVGGMDFMSDGRLAISTWDPSGSVYLLSNVDSGEPSQITVKQIARGLAEPLGLKVINDTIYVIQKQELTRLVDSDGDDVIDEYQCVNNSWPTSANFHEFAFGLAEKGGDLYATLAIAILPGGASAKTQQPSRGHAVRFDLPSGEMHYLASGLRTPNGIGIGIDNEIFVADNQGDWLPSSKILHITEGDFFGSRAVDYTGTENLNVKPPVVWLPQDEIGNSPSTPLAINDGPYKGQMIHSEVTHGGVKRVFVEKVNDAYQGVVFRFIQGLEAGINRMVWGPDSALYVGGVGNPGNWQHTDKLWYGLQRLKYNGKPTFEMLAVRAKSNGLEIEFTEPLREGDGWETNDWEIRQWRYVPTADYGGPKVDDKELKVVGAYVSDDRKKVSLQIEGIQSGHVVYVHLKDRYVSDAGRNLWSTEAWYTMNQIPTNNPVTVTTMPSIANNTLTAAESNNGWKLLFDGKTTEGWHNYNKQTIGKSWIVDGGTLSLDARKHPDGHWQAADGGDIVAEGEYENFELNVEWKISPCGNSGIIYNVVESPEYEFAWHTGPEMQILDDVCHPDTRFSSHRAGSLYDMIPCQIVTVKPAGEWNKVRIIKNNGLVEHWLNGVIVVSYDMNKDSWTQMINKSKFKSMPQFGRAKKGKIVLQDHGDKVWFRNIKIKTL